MAIPIGGGTEIIGEADTGTPSLIRTDPTTIGDSEEDSTYLFIVYEPKIMSWNSFPLSLSPCSSIYYNAHRYTRYCFCSEDICNP
jgi:hypothetical protein